MSSKWQAYEEAARKVLANIRQALSVETVEGKQVVAGQSGTEWEIDAKAWREDSKGFLVVEIRRRTTERLKQKDVAALAYEIQDCGAVGGIVISPLPMQKGAKLVAAAAGIDHVRLSPESTTEDYLAEFMGRRFHGLSLIERVDTQDTLEIKVIRADQNGGG